MVRAGTNGAMQDFALDNGLAVLSFKPIPDVSRFNDREELKQACSEIFPEESSNVIASRAGQLWTFANRIKKGDLIALPMRGGSLLSFGTVVGEYKFKKENPEDCRHTIPVNWEYQDIPRDRFPQDILNSLGSIMTVCQIKRNNSEERVRAILKGESPPNIINTERTSEPSEEESDNNVIGDIDIDQYTADKIRNFIRKNFPDHKMSQLIGGILEAQGYEVEVSPPGPDGGVDILAGKGPLGFEQPRLCVQVKATQDPQDVRVVRELRGVMKVFGADLGLFVSWSGYRRSVKSEVKHQYFEIRLWDSTDIIEQVQEHYDKLPDSIKADLPMKRIWTLVEDDDN